MAEYLARLLCIAGRHRFDYRITFLGGRVLDQCSRCGEFRNVYVAGLTTPEGQSNE